MAWTLLQCIVVGAVLRRKPYYRGLAFNLKSSKREILSLRDIAWNVRHALLRRIGRWDELETGELRCIIYSQTPGRVWHKPGQRHCLGKLRQRPPSNFINIKTILQILRDFPNLLIVSTRLCLNTFRALAGSPASG